MNVKKYRLTFIYLYFYISCMYTIAISNKKGGTGKTTLTANIGAALHALGKNILLIDLDPQASLSDGLGFVPGKQTETIYDLLINPDSNGLFKQATKKISDGFFLLPNNSRADDADIAFAGTTGRETLLSESIASQKIKGIDFCLIDCPPSLGILAQNAFMFADSFLVPVQPEYYAAAGLEPLFAKIKQINSRLRKQRPLEFLGVVIEMLKPNVNEHKEKLAMVKTHFTNKLFETAIQERIVIAEAPARGQHILSYAPNSFSAEQFKQLAKEILNKISFFQNEK